MGDVTRVLEAMQRREPNAEEALLSLVYRELLGMARHRMAQEPQGHTLQPTILVHDVWLKLFPEGQHPAFANRAHVASWWITLGAGVASNAGARPCG
jgi:hypothetical protein